MCLAIYYGYADDADVGFGRPWFRIDEKLFYLYLFC